MSDISAFISYSHRDREYADRLLVHLKPLERRFKFVAWSDSKIPAGARWKDVISEQLERASLVVLFISADFLASDFIMREEYPKALAKAERNGTRLIIICTSPCDLNSIDILDYQMLNTMDETLQDFEGEGAGQERIFANAAKAIRETLDSAAIAAGNDDTR